MEGRVVKSDSRLVIYRNLSYLSVVRTLTESTLPESTHHAELAEVPVDCQAGVTLHNAPLHGSGRVFHSCGGVHKTSPAAASSAEQADPPLTPGDVRWQAVKGVAGSTPLTARHLISLGVSG
jgi:hypothetical protein